MGIIYMATNLLNGKQYIGQSKNDWPQRKYRHITESNNGSNTYFHRAIKKYNKENFEWNILCFCKNEYLNFAEKYFIFAYGTQYPNGYNILSGGTGVYNYQQNNNQREKWFNKMKYKFYKVKCIETKKIYETSVIAQKETNIQSANILKCCKGQRKSAGGFHWCFADKNITIDEIEENRKRKCGISQRVLCIELNIIFDSVREAAKFIKRSPACISNCCNNKQEMSGGYHWKFIN